MSCAAVFRVGKIIGSRGVLLDLFLSCGLSVVFRVPYVPVFYAVKWKLTVQFELVHIELNARLGHVGPETYYSHNAGSPWFPNVEASRRQHVLPFLNRILVMKCLFKLRHRQTLLPLLPRAV